MRTLIEQVKKNLRHTKIFHVAKNNVLLRSVNAHYQNKYKQDKSKRLQEYGMRAIQLMKESFLQVDCEFWLDYGTLLGAVREKDFIGHDFDIDFGAQASPMKIQELEGKLLQRGFVKHREFSLADRIVEQTYTYEGVHIDIFYYEQSAPGKVSCYSLEAGEATKYEYFATHDEIDSLVVKKITSTFYGIKMIDFKGELFPIPADEHAYLVDNYGETYMIKNANWDWTTAVSNFEILETEEKTKAYIYKHP